jgi:hypothetical protein
MTAARAIRLPRLPKSLTVNALALMTATIGANGLGLVFWVVAAHLRPPAVVGQASAAVAALTLLSMIAQLNLTNVIVRLLPAAGRLGTYLVERAYLVVVFLSLVAGLVYCASGLGRHVVTGGWAQYAEFTVAVPVLAVFALEDSALTALRLAPAVAAENITTAIARIVLLPVLFETAMGAVWSWVLPALAAAVIVNSLLFGRALPAHGRVPGTLPPRRRLLSFVAGEYAGNICATAPDSASQSARVRSPGWMTRSASMSACQTWLPSFQRFLVSARIGLAAASSSLSCSYRTGMPVALVIAAAASTGVGWSPASSRVRPANRAGWPPRGDGPPAPLPATHCPDSCLR